MEQISIPCDLSESGLEAAAEQLGGFTPPHVVVCDSDKYLAQRLLSRIGWSWEVDPELPTDAWKVRLNGKTIYSPGA
jgi:hypothetical protein